MGGCYLRVEFHREGSALQPAQQACLLTKVKTFNPNKNLDPTSKELLIYDFLHKDGGRGEGVNNWGGGCLKNCAVRGRLGTGG